MTLCWIRKQSNRCSPTKAFSEWLRRDNRGGLVEGYLHQAGEGHHIRGLDRSPGHPFADPLYAVIARSGEREAD